MIQIQTIIATEWFLKNFSQFVFIRSVCWDGGSVLGQGTCHLVQQSFETSGTAQAQLLEVSVSSAWSLCSYHVAVFSMSWWLLLFEQEPSTHSNGYLIKVFGKVNFLHTSGNKGVCLQNGHSKLEKTRTIKKIHFFVNEQIGK